MGVHVDEIRVELDDDGVATTIQVRSDGLQRRQPSDVAALLIAADAAAAKDFRPERPPPRGRPGSMADLTARTFAAFDALPTEPHPTPIRIVLTSGRITGCAIDPDWLARASRAELARGLNQSLATARATRPDRLTELLMELKAMLRSYAQGG